MRGEAGLARRIPAGQDHRPARAGQVEHDLALAGLDGAQRLVEQEHVRLAEDPGSQPGTLEQRRAPAAHRSIGGRRRDARPRQRGLDPLRRVRGIDPQEARGEGQRLAWGEPRMDAGLRPDIGDAPPEPLRRPIGEAGDLHPPPPRPAQSGEDAEQRGPARGRLRDEEEAHTDGDGQRASIEEAAVADVAAGDGSRADEAERGGPPQGVGGRRCQRAHLLWAASSEPRADASRRP